MENPDQSRVFQLQIINNKVVLIKNSTQQINRNNHSIFLQVVALLLSLFPYVQVVCSKVIAFPPLPYQSNGLQNGVRMMFHGGAGRTQTT
jgi:hypothetical protein